MRDVKIKDVPLVESLTGQEKIPVSDGSGSPKAINVGQIFKTLHINTFSVTYTITEDMVGQAIQLFGNQLGGDPTALLYFGTDPELKPSTNIPITQGMYTFSKAGEYTFYIQAKPDIQFAGSFTGKNYIKKLEFRNCDICDFSLSSFSQICQASSVEEFVLENVVFRNKYITNQEDSLVNLFGGCTNLKTAIFDNITFKTAPHTIAGLAAGSSLETLTIRNCNFRGVSYISSFAPNSTTKYINLTDCIISKECACILFGGSQALLEVDLSNTNLYSINQLFSGCTSLQKIIMTGVIEGEANNSTFGGVPAGCKLYYDSGNIRNSNILEVAAEAGLVLIDVSSHLTKEGLTLKQEYVDLGLPSGTLWATCNVGASLPEECGAYFAWGETETKSDYNLNTYKWCKGTENSMTKYCMNSEYGIIDNRTVLEVEDDIAHALSGGNWRIPTSEEFEELIEKCTWEWTINNDVNGQLVTGPNGNSIFLPCTGHRRDTDFIYREGGFYWLSPLNESNNHSNCAYGFYFNSNDRYQDDNWPRYLGLSVRPVRNKQPILDNYYTKEETDGKLDNYYTKEEFDEKVPIKEEIYTKEEIDTILSISKYEFVDLGLPSGTLWATCNIEANSPEEYGGYYAWGETEEKSDYSWATYKWCAGTKTSMTKYCTNSEYGTVDNKTILDPEDDVAHVKWGGSWRMPTQEETTELGEDCIWTWTTQNGVYGMKVTGPNGNSIFLPAAGYRSGTGFSNRGEYGLYWPATLVQNYSSYAYYLHFFVGGCDLGHNWNRNLGLTVRPVMSKQPILSNYYTKEEIDSKGYLTEHQDLSNYALKSEIPTDYLTEIPEATVDTLGGVRKVQIDSIAEDSDIAAVVTAYNNLITKLTESGLIVSQLET